MSEVILDVIAGRIHRAHLWILEATEPLREEELCQRFGPTAPPIGWHLWHIARWADRVQASLPRADDPDHRPDPNQGIWERRGLAAQWDLDPTTLGTLEEGSGMDFEVSARLPQRIGQEPLLEYARQTFAATDAAIAALHPAQLLETRTSVMEYTYDVNTGKIWRAPGAETTLAADLGFHLSHTNRHLGMMEALRGLLEQRGTVTV